MSVQEHLQRMHQLADEASAMVRTLNVEIRDSDIPADFKAAVVESGQRLDDAFNRMVDQVHSHG